jgi:LTXXQ motif family protein
MMRDAAMKVPLALKDKSDLSYRVVDFGSAIERMIRACDQQVVELKKMPLDAVAQIVKPAEDQRQALEQIQSVALNSAETLAITCPKKLPEGLTERLAILSHTLEAMAGSLEALRPTLTTFYGLLNDEQKARLVAMGMSNDASGKQDVASKRSGSKQDSLCQQWVINLRNCRSGGSRTECLCRTNNTPHCMNSRPQFIERLTGWLSD